MSDEKILPCPFCGSPASVEETENGIGRTGSVCFSVGCDSTDDESCMGYQSLTTFGRRSDAIAAWNKRAPRSKNTEVLPDFVKRFPSAVMLIGRTMLPADPKTTLAVAETVQQWAKNGCTFTEYTHTGAEIVVFGWKVKPHDYV